MLSRRDFGALAGAVILAPLAALAGGRTHRVDIRRFTFNPARLTIRPGDSVEWVNHDIAPHTATDDDARWDTGEMTRGEIRARTFSAAGAHRYFCAFHPDMRGEIIVADT